MAAKGFVCYCPELKLYHIYQEDPSGPPDSKLDYKFDDEGLEMAIATHLANGREAEASTMSLMTGAARVNPHKFVVFDAATEKIDIVEPKDHFASLPKTEE